MSSERAGASAETDMAASPFALRSADCTDFAVFFCAATASFFLREDAIKSSSLSSESESLSSESPTVADMAKELRAAALLLLPLLFAAGFPASCFVFAPSLALARSAINAFSSSAFLCCAAAVVSFAIWSCARFCAALFSAAVGPLRVFATLVTAVVSDLLLGLSVTACLVVSFFACCFFFWCAKKSSSSEEESEEESVLLHDMTRRPCSLQRAPGPS